MGTKKKVVKPAKAAKELKKAQVEAKGNKSKSVQRREKLQREAEPEVKPLPLFEGARVLEVLEENVNGKWNHCKMSDGTTKHVPLELFD